MSKPVSWIWNLYFFLYLALVPIPTIYFFAQESEVFWFYHILTAFDPGFVFPYLLNALAVILAMVSVVPFYLFITGGEWLTPSFWRILLAVRLTADLTGRSYELLFFKSSLHQSPLAAASLVGIWLFFYVPSYTALYLHAFRPRKT